MFIIKNNFFNSIIIYGYFVNIFFTLALLLGKRKEEKINYREYK